MSDHVTDFDNLVPETQLEIMRQHPEHINQYWGELMPLDEFNLPEFPLHCLPPVLADFAGAVAHSVQASPDMAAVSLLCSVAACAQEKYSIRLKSDWIEQINLYCLIISPPSTGKSQIFKPVTKPILQFEHQRAIDLAGEISKSKAQKKLLVARADSLLKLSAKSSKHEEDYKKAQKELDDFKPVFVPRYILDDVTPEQLIKIMYQNGGFVSVMSAESTIFDNIAGRYSSGVANIDAFLKAYTGDPIRVNRQDREEFMTSPRLTMLISTQPDAFDDIKSNRSFSGKGLLSRILYSIPKPPQKQTFDTNPIPQNVRNNYDSLCKMLLTLPYNGCALIDIDEESRAMFAELYEKMSRLKVGDLEYMNDWAGKFCGNVARIAAVLYLAEQTVFTEREPLPGRIMKNAILIGEYFLEHAKKVYLSMGADKDTSLAMHIIKKLKKKPQYIVNKHDLYRMCRGKVSGVKDLDEPINTLIEHGYLRATPEEPGRTPGKGGRKKEPRFALNPIYFNLL